MNGVRDLAILWGTYALIALADEIHRRREEARPAVNALQGRRVESNNDIPRERNDRR